MSAQQAPIAAPASAGDAPPPRAKTSESGFRYGRLDLLLFVVLFALAVAPRAAWAAYNDREPKELNDPTFYRFFGGAIANGDGYTRLTGEKFAYYPVGYPATIAGLHKAGEYVDKLPGNPGWDRTVFSIKMMNGMFGVLTVLMLYALGARMFDRRAAFFSGALLSLFPSQVYYTGTILSEPEFTMLLVAAITVLLWHPWSRDGMSWQRLAVAGLILSGATMVRGITLVFPLLLLGFWLVYLHSRKQALIQTGILFLGIAVLIVPWSIRNTLAFDTLTGPSTNVGDDLCIGNFYGATGYFVIEGPCFEGVEGLKPMEVEKKRNREGVRIAIRDLVQHPFRIPNLVKEKAYWLLYNDDDGLIAAQSYGHDSFIPIYRFSVLSFAANAVYYATGFVVIVGAAAFALSRDIRRAVWLATMLYILAVPLAFFGDPRFHYPAIPFAILIAGATVVAMWDQHMMRRLPAVESLR